MPRKNNSLSRMPDFLVIGPQKAGTTWIQRFFETRGDIGLPKGVKETFFFDRYYDRGIKWYGRHFQFREPHRRSGEVATTYFHHPLAPTRILSELGRVPLIVTLRDPARRAFSLYLHLRRYGQTRLGFRGAVRRLPLLLESSRYATMIKRWMESFGRTNLLILRQEQLATEPERFACEIADFLQLPQIPLDESLGGPVNAAAIPPSFWLARTSTVLADMARSAGLYQAVSVAKRLGLKSVVYGSPRDGSALCLGERDRAWFVAQLRDEIDELEKLLDLDLSSWKASSLVLATPH